MLAGCGKRLRWGKFSLDRTQDAHEAWRLGDYHRQYRFRQHASCTVGEIIAWLICWLSSSVNGNWPAVVQSRVAPTHRNILCKFVHHPN